MAFDGEIARRIARDIGAALSPALHDRLSGSSQIVSEAQDEYLRGRFASNAYTADGDREALRHFLNAVELDPSYALAHIALATAQRVRATQSSSPDREEFYRRARESARRAAQLDETLPGAHLAMANIELYSTWNWNAAEAEFTRALQLNPNDADAHQQYAWFLAARGQTDQALRQAQQARDLDPLTLIRSTTAAGILYYARRHAEAIKELQGVLAIDPNFVVAHTGLARTYAALRDFDQAVIEIRRAIALVGDDPAWLAELGRIDGEAGNTAEARRIARQVESRAAAGAFVGPETFAGLYAAADDRERAFRVLEAGVRSRSSGLLWIKVDPRFDSLRGDPRFDRILELGGLHR